MSFACASCGGRHATIGALGKCTGGPFGRPAGSSSGAKLGARSEATRAAPEALRERRIYHCNTHFDRTMAAPGEELPAMPEHPPDDGASRPKWNSKWEFDREGKRVRIVVVAHGPRGKEMIDAREFIERLGENHRYVTFAIHVETEQIGA